MQVPVHDFEGDLKFGLWHDGLLVVGRVPDGHAAKYCEGLNKPEMEKISNIIKWTFFIEIRNP